MDKYIIKPKQSLFDVAVEVYGDVQAINWILEDNRNIPGPTGPVLVGQEISIRGEKMNARVVAYLEAFGPFQTIDETDKPGGIGFWNLEQYEVQ